jgi:hypothetical protein
MAQKTRRTRRYQGEDAIKHCWQLERSGLHLRVLHGIVGDPQEARVGASRNGKLEPNRVLHVYVFRTPAYNKNTIQNSM